MHKVLTKLNPKGWSNSKEECWKLLVGICYKVRIPIDLKNFGTTGRSPGRTARAKIYIKKTYKTWFAYVWRYSENYKMHFLSFTNNIRK